MRYPSNIQYRNVAPDGGGFQSQRPGPRKPQTPGNFRLPKGVKNIGAKANDNPLFRKLGLDKRTVGQPQRWVPKRALRRLARGRKLAGLVVRGSPYGAIFSAANSLFDIYPHLYLKPDLNAPAGLLIPPGSGWYKYAGTWTNYGYKYYNFPAHQAKSIYHRSISGQSISGKQPLGSPIPDSWNTLGFWIARKPGYVFRSAHYESYKRPSSAPRVSTPFEVSYATAPAILPVTPMPVNPWAVPLTRPGLNYPFPRAARMLKTGSRPRPNTRETSEDGPPRPRGKAPRHKRKDDGDDDRRKSKKMVAAISTKSFRGKTLSAIGEVLEYIDILARSVDSGIYYGPGSLKRGWKQQDMLWRLQRQKWADQDKRGVKKTVLTPQEKAQFVWDNWEKINWEKARQGFFNNHIEDKIFGAIGRQGAKANRRDRRIVGYQTGWAL